jgi:adenine-specific DNA-methyltransferase
MNKIQNSGSDTNLALMNESVEIIRREEWVNPPALKHYRTNFYGNKRALLPDIAALIPRKVKTIFDAFSGTGIVSWALKHRGYRIIANDVMRYPHYRLRAVVRNNSTVLDYRDLKLLTEPNPNRPDYISTFYGQTYGESNCLFLETWASNINKLSDPVKRDLAIFIPIVCISKYLKFAAVHFSPFGTLTGDQTLSHINLAEDICAYAIETFPTFLYDNQCQNECYQIDTIELLPTIEADMAYFDPPYACRAGSYEGHYAYFDDLASILSGKGEVIANPFDARCELPPYTFYGTRRSAVTGLAKLFERSLHIPHILLSYNTTSLISPNEIATLARTSGRHVTIQFIDRPRPTTQKNRNTETQEVLMLCE